MSAFKVGTTIVYDDGREGHRAVKARVLAVDERTMTVQFEDRADTTTIRFNDPAWMNFISTSAG